jgi:hypothetical protein
VFRRLIRTLSGAGAETIKIVRGLGRRELIDTGSLRGRERAIRGRVVRGCRVIAIGCFGSLIIYFFVVFVKPACGSG